MKALERIKLSSELNKLNQSFKDGAITGFELSKSKKRANEIKALLAGPDYKLFPTEEVNQGFYHSSRQSEQIAQAMQEQYYQVITQAIEKAKPEVKTPEQETALKNASEELQDLYISKVKALASSRSGVMSSFMAGRSNFNASQANRRGNAFDKVALGFENWVENVAPNFVYQSVRQAMSQEQRKEESEIRNKEAEEKKKLKLENDAQFLWRILEPKKFPMEYSKDMLITKVSFTRDKIPSSVTIAMKDGSHLTDDKILLSKVFKNIDELINFLKEQGKEIPTSWSEMNIKE